MQTAQRSRHAPSAVAHLALNFWVAELVRVPLSRQKTREFRSLTTSATPMHSERACYNGLFAVDRLGIVTTGLAAVIATGLATGVAAIVATVLAGMPTGEQAAEQMALVAAATVIAAAVVRPIVAVAL